MTRQSSVQWKPITLHCKPPSEMDYDELEKLALVFLAMCYLYANNMPQTPIMISRILKRTVSIPTISKYRNWLYWYGVVIPEDKYPDPSTWQGSNKVRFVIRPYLAPYEMWELFTSDYVWERQLKAVEALGIATRIDDNHLQFHPAVMLKRMGDNATEFLRSLTQQARRIYSKAPPINDAWLIRHGDNQIIELTERDRRKPFDSLWRLETLFRSFEGKNN